jgi:hypothetical protein
LKQKNRHGPPVVYLRSFAGETFRLADLKAAFIGKIVPGTSAYWADVGDYVVDHLKVIGPAKALARPDGAWSMRPWAPSRAKRVAVPNEKWQQEIAAWLPKAALVVVQLGVSEGLAWELRQIVRLVSATKVLLVLPSTQADYDTVRAGTASALRRPLPSPLPPSRLMTFKADWNPLPLRSAGDIWDTLDPVFAQNDFASPKRVHPAARA